MFAYLQTNNIIQSTNVKKKKTNLYKTFDDDEWTSECAQLFEFHKIS